MAFANGHDAMDVDSTEVDERPAWLIGRYTKEIRPCRLCDGYYGPNFNEPVCATCHSFVYPRLPDEEEEAPPPDAVCKPEDDDSGNEEPEADEALISPAKALNWENGSAGQRTGSNNVIVVSKRRRSDSLAEQIQMLTCPRPLPLSKRYANQIPVLPPEVWTKVFSFLDDFSLWSVGQVCQSWRILLELESVESNSLWRNSVAMRWPVVSTLRRVTEKATRGSDFWWRVYGALVGSAPCKSCIHQLVLPQSDENGDSNPGTPPNGVSIAGAVGGVAGAAGDAYRDETWRSNRLRMEMKILAYEETEGINAVPLNEEKSVWQASLVGPRGSPYENGIFYLMIKLPKVYPLKPPLVRFLTKIFHPNVSRHGDIGIDCIRHNWTVALSISTILLSIQSIFTDPYTHVCMEPAIGKLYTEDYLLFNEIARRWTRRYATHHLTIVIPPANQQQVPIANPNGNQLENGGQNEIEPGGNSKRHDE